MEALRLGAAEVLDMEVEDLQLLVVGQPGGRGLSLLLYDPMPGGSGLLDQMRDRWQEVTAIARLCVSQPVWIASCTSGIRIIIGTSSD